MKSEVLRTNSLEMAAEIAAALMKQPRTVPSIYAMLGKNTRHTARPRRHVAQFKASGCIHIVSWERSDRPVYAWQPKPFALPDAPRPGKKGVTA